MNITFRVIGIVLLALAGNSLHAQSLSVFDVDTSAFPIMKAKFYAFDAAGKQQTPAASEIIVTEGALTRKVISVTCPTQQPLQVVSVAMSIDISGSMRSSDVGEVPVELGKLTAKELVANLTLPPSEMAVQTCHDKAAIIQDFTSDKSKLNAAITPVTAGGNNDFVEHLLNAKTGILNVAKSGRFKRVAVLYTDAWWYALSSSELQQCINLCNTNNITFYAIIYTRPEAEPNGIKKSLQALADATGGKLYDGVTSQGAAKDIAGRIQEQAQGGDPCELSWESGTSCKDNYQQATFTWSGATSSLTYPKPYAALSRMSIIPSSLYIRSKPIGQTFDTTLTVTAVNAAFTVTDIISTNPIYTISPRSFALAKGQSQVLTVSYTPPDSSYTWTEFEVKTDLCDKTINISGVYLTNKPFERTIHVDHPNGGEIFAAGSDTVITWSGIPTSDVVKLEFSSDGGTTWKFISDRGRDKSLAWRVPGVAGNNYLVRVAHESVNGWAKSFGGNLSDEGRSVTVDASNNIYVTGAFIGTVDFGGKTLTSTGSTYNTFIAKYYPDGMLEWAKSVTGGTSHGSSIRVDPTGAIYLAAEYFRDSVDFGGTRLFCNNTTQYTGFIAKYLNDGTLLFAKKIGGMDEWSRTTVTAMEIDSTGNFYLGGAFAGWCDFGGVTLVSQDLNSDLYVAKYKADGTVEWADHIRCAEKSNSYLNNTITALSLDKAGNIYVAGYLDEDSQIGSTAITIVGEADLFLAKYFPDGKVDWVDHFGGPRVDLAEDIEVVDGSLYVSGSFQDSIDLDGIRLASSWRNLFVAKFRLNGSIEWAKGVTNCASSKLAAMKTGVYVSGRISGPADFGGISLNVSSSDQGIFIAKYRLDGATEWVNRFKSTYYYPTVNDLCLNAQENIHVIGNFEKQLDVGNTTLSSNGNYDAFLCMIQNFGELQSDSSDAVFSVVLPEPRSQDVDMGKVLVGKSKDSSIVAFVSNAGQYPFIVRSISLAGTNPSMFKLVSGIPPFTVPAKGARAVEIRFSPTTVGPKSAEIVIITQTDTLRQSIIGEGVQPQVTTIGKVIDFGSVKTMTQKDTAIKVALKNIGTAAVTFTGDRLLGPDLSQFSVLSGGGTFTLQPNESREVRLRFAPTSKGRTSGSVGFDFDGPGSPAILQLFGEGAELRKEVTVMTDTIDFGKVQQYASKDTTVSVVILNTGTVAVTFSGNIQLGPDKTQFSIVTGGGSFVLKPNESRDLTLRFSPTVAGLTSGSIGFVHDGIASPATIYLFGEGMPAPVEVTAFADTIDFGPVEVREWKDTTIVVGLTNRSTVPFTFSSDVQLGPDVTQFQVRAGGGQFTLQPGESREVTLRFAPIFIGHAAGSIGFTYNGKQGQVVLNVKGQGIGGRVTIVDDSAHPGETKQIAMRLSNVSFSKVQSIAANFRARVAYNPTVLLPSGGDIIPGLDRDTVTVMGSLTSDNTLTPIPFLAALGNAEVSAVDLVEFVWLDAKGAPANYDVETQGGTFKLLGICEEGGKRLFNPDGEVAIASIAPNPARGSMEVEIKTLEKGRTQVQLLDVLGRTVGTLYDGEIDSGEHTLLLNTSGIAAGSYYLSLITPTVRKIARVDIAR